MKTVEISDAAYERLQHLMARFDANPDLAIAFTEGDTVAFALMIADYTTGSNRPDATIQRIIAAALFDFEDEEL